MVGGFMTKLGDLFGMFSDLDKSSDSSVQLLRYSTLLDRTESTGLEEPCLENTTKIPVPTWKRKLWRATKVYIGPILLFLVYSFSGAALFHHLESQNELDSIKRIKLLRVEMLKKLWSFALEENMTEEIWSQEADKETRMLDDLQRHLLQPGIAQAVYKDDGEQMWTFWGALLFCGTVSTTIGYGFIVPKTVGGRAACMVYALLGIPLCMMVLAKIGKLLSLSLGRIWVLIKQTAEYMITQKTNCLKFKPTDKNEQCQSDPEIQEPSRSSSSRPATNNDVTANHVGSSRPLEGHSSIERTSRSTYDPEQTPPPRPPEGSSSRNNTHRHTSASPDSDDKDVTSYDDADNSSDVTLSTEEDFSLSPVFAVIVLVLYILTGATMYGQWETWDYFESAYFIFTSLTTIGFGDLTPAHPKYFISSSIYIFVGLTLVSLVINTIIETLKKGMKKAKAAPAVILKRHQMINLKKERDSYEEIAMHHPLEHGDSVQLASIRIPRDPL